MPNSDRSHQHSRVSVVVPTYNYGQYLLTCLDAIWHQDVQDLQLIVVDAASTDNTRELLVDWSDRIGSEQVDYARYWNEESGVVERESYPRYPKAGRQLEIIHLDEDPGLPETYNIGLRKCTGDFTTAIVSDDIPHPSMCRMLADALAKGADFAYGDMWVVDDAGRIIREFRFPDYEPKTCLADWYLMGSARMWRTSLHEQVGFMDPDYPSCHDYDLILRFAEAGGSFVHVPQVLYSARWHGPDRKVGMHAPGKENRIFEESKRIAARARAWLSQPS
jgi:glycosyltransferase involved in cell wall biosynthesis